MSETRKHRIRRLWRSRRGLFADAYEFLAEQDAEVDAQQIAEEVEKETVQEAARFLAARRK